MIDDELNWSSQVDKLTTTTQRNISVIRRAKIYLAQNSLKLLYNSLVLPHFDYCSAVWSNINLKLLNYEKFKRGQQD